MSSKICTVFINKQTGQVFGEASANAGPQNPISGQAARATAPFSGGRNNRDVAPVPTNLNYNTSIRAFTDAFSLTVELTEDENFDIGSHDFVEFFFEMDNPADGFKARHQIGVGFLEKFNKQTSAATSNIQANGRDLFGQFLFAPFTKPIAGQTKTLKTFINDVISGSYLDIYFGFRGDGKSKLVDKGLFSRTMLFRSDLEEKKGETLQKYAELAINLLYMNRLGQVEVIGKPGTTGSTAGRLPNPVLGELKKGLNIDDIVVIQDFTNVFSQFTVFWVSGQAEQSRNTLPSQTFTNDDPRVAHIDKPGFRTFSMGELKDLGGSVNAINRLQDIAKSIMRKANAGINSVVVVTADPYFTNANGTQIPYVIGQKWRIRSNEAEFTSANQPKGTDSIEMILDGINYSQNPNNQQIQLRFVEEDTIL